MLYHRKTKLLFGVIAVLTLVALIVVKIQVSAAHANTSSTDITLSGSIGAHDPSRMIIRGTDDDIDHT